MERWHPAGLCHLEGGAPLYGALASYRPMPPGRWRSVVWSAGILPAYATWKVALRCMERWHPAGLCHLEGGAPLYGALASCRPMPPGRWRSVVWSAGILPAYATWKVRSEEHTSELQSRENL